MGLGIYSWLFYGLGIGKKIPSVEVFEVFKDADFQLKLNFSHQSFGGLPATELAFIASMAQYLQCQNIFEFGTCTGVTTYNLAANTSGKIYTLDLAEAKSATLKLDEADKEYIGVNSNHLYWNGKPEESRIIALKGDSALFDTSKYLKKMDLVFVDASHSYDYVLNDSKKSLEMLKPDGVILWHDYMPAWTGVVKALNELSSTMKLFHIRGTSLVMYAGNRLCKDILQGYKNAL